MITTFRCFARLMILVAISLSGSTLAEEVDVIKDQKLRIGFLSTRDWIEVEQVENIPEKFVVQLVPSDGGVISIATFNQAGPALPELASIFKNTVEGR
jgi:hypothetical protein